MKDLGEIMKQAQVLQEKLAGAQAELQDMEIEGSSGGGLVRIVMNGRGALRAIKIDDSLLKTDEKEILEDLIVAAFNDAKTKMETAVAEKMQALTGGLPMPPGFNLGG